MERAFTAEMTGSGGIIPELFKAVGAGLVEGTKATVKESLPEEAVQAVEIYEHAKKRGEEIGRKEVIEDKVKLLAIHEKLDELIKKVDDELATTPTETAADDKYPQVTL